MARLIAGGNPGDVATAVSAPVLPPQAATMAKQIYAVAGVSCAVYAARTGGTALTDLQLDADGSTISAVVTDATGQIPAFRLPDGLVVDGVWLDPFDSSTARFFVPVRITRDLLNGSYALKPSGTATAGYVPTVQSDGSVAYAAPAGGDPTKTIVGNYEVLHYRRPPASYPTATTTKPKAFVGPVPPTSWAKNDIWMKVA